MWPWILHGVEKKGGGPVLAPGCECCASGDFRPPAETRSGPSLITIERESGDAKKIQGDFTPLTAKLKFPVSRLRIQAEALQDFEVRRALSTYAVSKNPKLRARASCALG
jgi:hypothetical protein